MPNKLTKKYGVAQKPAYIEDAEKAVKPLSLHRLNKKSANWLKLLMEVTSLGLGVSRYVYKELPILWLIDEGGVLWFSVEELVGAAPPYKFQWPKWKKAKFGKRTTRLGHPALIGGNKARIGGEISFDVNYEPPSWIISNASGRYGYHKRRKRVHLTNAANRFRRYGMDFVELPL